jgi:hypothetical protein
MMMIQSVQGSQGQHRASTHVARVGQRAGRFLEKVQHMADRIVSGEEKITDATRQALDTIDQEMDDIIAHASQNQQDFQAEVDRAKQSIETCGTDTTTAHTKAGGINDMADAVNTARNNHNTCRSDEATLKQDATTKCDDFSSYKGNLQAPACSCPGTAISEQCILNSKDWFTTAASSWSNKEGLCDDATGIHSGEREVCNSEQGGLESDFCSYATALKLTCSTQETCRSEQIGLRDQAHADVAVSESAFKAEHESAKHVKCILKVLNATDDAKQNMLSACKSATIDSSHLSITYPPIPSAATCDLTPVAEQPGDDAWRTAEYGGKTWNAVGKAPVLATVSCPTATTSATTAAPPAATTAAPAPAAPQVVYTSLDAELLSSAPGQLSLKGDYTTASSNGASAYTSEAITETSVRRGVSFKCNVGDGGYNNGGYNSKMMALQSASGLSTKEPNYGLLDFFVWCGNTGSYFRAKGVVHPGTGRQDLAIMDGYAKDSVFTIRAVNGDIIVTKDGVVQYTIEKPTINYPLHVMTTISHSQDPAFTEVEWVA